VCVKAHRVLVLIRVTQEEKQLPVSLQVCLVQVLQVNLVLM
jgi:hypothetical protein